MANVCNNVIELFLWLNYCSIFNNTILINKTRLEGQTSHNYNTLLLKPAIVKHTHIKCFNNLCPSLFVRNFTI